ncbi:MAG: restriction endonuclease subunit R, partial [Desulfuromusa sp.]|nr:restriction endonuclease subunit R [Desulfuromusa sp.]
DFVAAYKHFSDEEWDGEPIEPEPCDTCGNYPCTCSKEPCPECGNFPCTCEPVPCPECGNYPCSCEKPPCPKCGQRPCVCNKKVIIKLADGKERTIQHIMATTFWSPDGKPMSAKEFIEHLYGELPELFKDEDELRSLWGKPETRKKLLEGLAEKGFGEEQLTEARILINAENSDVFDVLAYIAFALSPISRKERVDNHKEEILTRHEDQQQAFLEFVLGEYIKEGVGELDLAKLPGLLELQYGNAYDAAAQLGGAQLIRETFTEFQRHLYTRDD